MSTSTTVTTASDPIYTVLRLTVNNHPGVMSHVCGLFARRAYNLEGIMVRPLPETQHKLSRMWLLVSEDDKLEQIIRQTEKLADVLSVDQHAFAGSVFETTAGFFTD